MDGYPRRDSADVVREHLPLQGARVLDVGCGDGALVRMMVREGAEATGLEISESQLTRARAASPTGDESYRVGRAEALPFDDDTFDVVVFFNSLHHVPTSVHEKALAEAARVLVPGGHLLVVEPLAEGPLFTLMRPVDDETEVRAAAYAALRRAAEGPAYEEIREYSFASDYCYESFGAFRESVLRVDASRRANFERHEPQLREGFERTARSTAEGFSFTHPKRLNLLKRL
jgi:ubiquinone/menaquinone biosynthesis C-methylase UbiE